MKIDILKKRLKIIAIKAAIAISAAAVFFAATYSYKDSSSQQNQTLNSEKDSVLSNINQKNAFYEEAKKSYERFEIMNPEKLATETGLSAAHERISSAIPVFNSLKDIYKFTKLDFTISSTETAKNLNSPSFDIFESPVSVDYEGVSDEFVFSFLNDLKYAIPGFIEIKTFDISKKDSPENPNNISDVNLVSGKIEILWRTLKSKAGATNAAPNPNNPSMPAM